MGYPKLVVFMRHAESVGNVRTRDENIAAGIAPHDYAITQRGVRQAVSSGKYLWDMFGDFDAHYVSTYPRTRQTLDASLIVPRGGVIKETSLLDEAQFGIYHYHSSQALNALYPKERERQKHIGYYHYRPFGGENWADIELRVRMLMMELERDWSGKKVLLVGHGNLFAAFRRVIEGISTEEMLSMSGLNPISNCGVAAYDGVGPWYTPWNKTRLVPLEIVIPWLADDF